MWRLCTQCVCSLRTLLCRWIGKRCHSYSTHIASRCTSRSKSHINFEWNFNASNLNNHLFFWFEMHFNDGGDWWPIKNQIKKIQYKHKANYRRSSIEKTAELANPPTQHNCNRAAFSITVPRFISHRHIYMRYVGAPSDHGLLDWNNNYTLSMWDMFFVYYNYYKSIWSTIKWIEFYSAKVLASGSMCW